MAISQSWSQRRYRTGLISAAVAIVWLPALQAQKCPTDAVNIVELRAQMESTKDPNVILRAAAIGEQRLLPELRKLSVPRASAESVGGAATASLAKLGDEAAYAQLESELNANTSVLALDKLLLVNSPRSVSMIMAYLASHPEAIWRGCELDACYDYVPIILKLLANTVENAPIRAHGKYRRDLDDWLAWSKREKPIVFSISSSLQDAYEQCLAHKVEWGFDMALVDLAATGDQSLMGPIKKLGTMGYPYEGYIGTKGPPTFIWLRHDYVETSLAMLGDDSQFRIIVKHLNSNSFQTEIQKLQIIGGSRAVEALINASRYFNGVWGRPFLKALPQMVENPPLPPDATLSAENITRWKNWWAENKSRAKFVKAPAFE